MVVNLRCAISYLGSFAALVSVLLAATPARADINALPLGLVGSIQSVRGTALGIDVQGTTAYLGDWGGGTGNFQTYSVSDPEFPVRLFATETSQEIGDLDAEGAFSFVANDYLGLTIYDVTNPSAPTLIAARNDSVYAHAVTVATVNARQYAAVGNIYAYTTALSIYDVTTPSALGAPTFYPAAVDAAFRDVYDVQIADDIAYVLGGDGVGNNRLDVLDLSPLPAPPVLLGTLALPHSALGFIGQARLFGSYLVAMAAETSLHVGGVRVIDIYNPLMPSLVGSLDVANVGSVPWKGAGGDLANGLVYLATKTGLAVIDLATPTQPAFVTSYAWPAAFGSLLGGHVKVVAPLAYAAAYADTGSMGGLAIFKIAPTTPPVRTVSIDIQPGAGVGCLNMNGHGTVPVVIFGESTLDVRDIDVMSLELQGLAVKVVGKSPRALASIADVNADGIADLVVHFADSDEWVTPGSDTATMTGTLTNGQQIRGQDTICVVADSTAAGGPASKRSLRLATRREGGAVVPARRDAARRPLLPPNRSPNDHWQSLLLKY